jgi:hypothetical protein
MDLGFMFLKINIFAASALRAVTFFSEHNSEQFDIMLILKYILT